MRTDLFLSQLRDYILAHPKQAGQSDDERTLQVLGALIKGYDNAAAEEQRIREEQAKQNPPFYCFVEVKTAQTYIVELPDFEAFLRAKKLDRAKMDALAQGEIAEWRGFRRGSNIHAIGRPYKPPTRPEVHAELQRRAKEAEGEKKRLQRLNENVYTTPPVPTTVHFTPQNGDYK